MFFDTHAHLHVKQFDSDMDDVVSRAKSNGIDFINVGFDVKGNEETAKLAQKFNVSYSLGIHPHSAHEATPEALNRIEQLWQMKLGKGMVAVGEIGLDFYKNPIPRQIQIHAFESQIRLAKKLNLPVIIHCRDAFDEVLRICKQEGVVAAVFHCFTGSLIQARVCWDLGYYTSFTGIITYPRAEQLRDVVKNAPPDRIMIETDCPFLVPEKFRGMRNEPLFVKEIALKIAVIKNLSISRVEVLLETNSRIFFRL